MKTIYLDNASTTKVYDEVVKEMKKYMQDEYGNPSSTHQLGEDAFNAMSPQFPLHPVFFTADELCMEVDDFEDLEKAEKLFKIATAKEFASGK